jgi:hypothetical protein
MAVQFPSFPGGHNILLDQPAEPTPMGSNHQGTPPEASASVQHARPPRASHRPIPLSRFDLKGLPPELQLAMMRHIHNNPDRPAAAQSLDAIIANRGQVTVDAYSHAVLGNDKNLARSHMKLLSMVAEVDGLPTGNIKRLPVSLLRLASAQSKQAAFNADAAIEDDLDKLVQFTHWSGRLAALDEHQVRHLVDFAVKLDDPNLEDNLSSMIGAMGSGLHVLNHDQHLGLVGTIVEMTEEGISRALEDVGQGLGALHADCVKALVDRVQNMTDDEYKSMAISGLAEGIDAMTADHCTALARAALSIQDDEYRDDAIAALGPHLHRFNPELQMQLADAALVLRDDDDHQVRALNAVASGLSKLAPDEYANVLSKLVSAMPLLPAQNRVNLMAACASALQQSDEEAVIDLHAHLVNDALELAAHDDRAHVVGSFGAGLHALSEGDRDRLVTSALVSAGRDEDAAGQAVARLSNGLGALTTDQAASMFKALLNIRDERRQSRAIATVLEGDGARALTSHQLDVLVIKAMGIKAERNKSVVIQSFREVLPALTESQLSKLVIATVTLTDTRLKASTIEALSGISGEHRNHLIDATRSLAIDRRIAALGWLATSVS